jgi:Icc-related predicted phosphoesterase
VGSRAIRDFIAAGQPHLTLHGHIHEGPRLSGDYKDRIGKTLAVNPGQLLSKDHGFPDLQGVVFDLEDPEETLTHTGLFRPLLPEFRIT